MIRLDTLADLATAPGPFATAYFDATRAEELAPRIVATRWRALREALEAAGADSATLDAMQAAAGSEDHVPGAHGRVLVGSGGTLRWDVALPAPPPHDFARFSPLPHLMPAVTALGPREPYIVALVDRVGADVTVHGPDTVEERTIEGKRYPIRKTGLGGWSALRYEHRAEDLWERNARQVAEVIESEVRRVAPAVVILAGDVRAREALRRVLAEAAAELVVELQTGGRAEGIDEEKLRHEIDTVVARVAADRDQAVIDRFTEAYGRAKAGAGDVLAAAGVADTVDALRSAEVEHLLIVEDPDSEAQAWIGPEPTHLGLTVEELTALGVDAPTPERLDAALVRAAAGTGAAVVSLAPGQLDLPDGLGATLRYPRPALG
ncbi:MAG TPA: Vms1/Ankzf1 family peptidyl-tRNA hydrolase [Mycobacteriales bacterium]